VLQFWQSFWCSADSHWSPGSTLNLLSYKDFGGRESLRACLGTQVAFDTVQRFIPAIPVAGCASRPEAGIDMRMRRFQNHDVRKEVSMLRSMLPAWSTPRFDSLLSVPYEMDRVFGSLLNGARPAAHTFLPLTIWEDEKGVYIEAEIPGAKIDDVELVFHDGALRLAYTRNAPEGERNYWLNERGYGRFERVVRLPETIDEESIQAHLEAGVLRVGLNKKPELQPRKITVQATETKPALESNSTSQN
jgi:HSP20 family protein